MPKVQTFTVKAKVDESGNISLDHTTRKEKTEGENLIESFNDSEIAKKSQEVASFNNTEQTLIKSLGKGEYEIDLKLIV